MPRRTGHSVKCGVRRNRGFVFVNFRTPERAKEFVTFSDFTFPGSFSTKRCYTKPAQRQGYKANWEKYKQQHAEVCCRIFHSTAQ